MFFYPMFKTLDGPDLEQCVFVQLGLNSPVGDDKAQDNRRFNRHAGTVREFVEADHRVIPMVHQGHPDGDDSVSFEQHADILTPHIDREAELITNIYGDDAIVAIGALKAGDMLLLENTRMCDGELPEKDSEVKADAEFVRTLTEYVDAYVNDTHPAAHHSYASLVGSLLVLPACVGHVIQIEYETGSSIATHEFGRQVMMVVGGTKVIDVIDVMSNLGDKADQFLLGGIAGELLLHATGNSVGFDLEGMDFFDDQWEVNHETIESLFDERGNQIKFTVDLAYEDETDDRGEVTVANITEKGRVCLDASSMTIDEYDPVIHDPEAVLARGTPGLLENECFAVGTTGVLRAIAETDRFFVVGGGDTPRAIGMYGMDEANFDHVPTASGTHIRALTGTPLASVETLKQD